MLRDPKATPSTAKEITNSMGVKGAQSRPRVSTRHTQDTHGKPEGQEMYVKPPDQPGSGRFVIQVNGPRPCRPRKSHLVNELPYVVLETATVAIQNSHHLGAF